MFEHRIVCIFCDAWSRLLVFRVNALAARSLGKEDCTLSCGVENLLWHLGHELERYVSSSALLDLRRTAVDKELNALAAGTFPPISAGDATRAPLRRSVMNT